jgi:hypothetical protein
MTKLYVITDPIAGQSFERGADLLYKDTRITDRNKSGSITKV